MDINTLELFPFEFTPVSFDDIDNAKCSFVKNVETILATDLQSMNCFGCRIKNCHTHAGSKVHFKDFIEAELLFHNSYYNKGFAILTVDEIQKKITYSDKKIERVLLIGYENYSELYLQEVVNLISERVPELKCDYCVYETKVRIKEDGERATEAIIRNLHKTDESKTSFYLRYGFGTKNERNKKIYLKKSLLVFIVPINTTLSTMDKMISLFKQQLGITKIINNNLLLLSLITIGPVKEEKKTANYYWTCEKDILCPIDKRFIEINSNNKIKTFAFVKSKWMYNNKDAMKSSNTNTFTNSENEFCEDCFPDIGINNDLLTENPIFDVTRGSVVPMLQLGKNDFLHPVEDIIKTSEIDNLKKVWKISGHMAYRHLVRGDNHFQFYFDSIGFITEESKKTKTCDNEIVEFLNKIKTDEHIASNNDIVVYNYIVAPRHETNAKWVDIVCNTVFSGNENYNPEFDGARILYFDVTKEYRSNILAKYSDFYCMLNNIKKSGQKCEIRFHYVDETITSGRNFIRAIDLIRSLLADINNINQSNLTISLFHSIFLLYGRSSVETKMFYMNLLNDINLDWETKESLRKHFYEYVHINVSTMRSHEDACTLCKLANDYRKIKNYCATKLMTEVCNEVIADHKIFYIENFDDCQKNFLCSNEKRLVFFISHLLNQRLGYRNKPIFANEKEKLQVDIESSNAKEKICDVLFDYYQNAFIWLTDEKIVDSSCLEDYKIAFIKAISRPFFTFHLRKRQAAFSFCLNLLNSLIETNTECDEETSKLILTLFKALSDMNANYIIREKIFNRLLIIAEKSGFDDHSKKNFNAINLIHSIKKMMSLTQDTTKSLLLEYLLVEGSENNFFNKTNNCLSQKDYNLNFYKKCGLSVKGVLYLENNRIIIDALKDIEHEKVDKSKEFPYFFDNFESICRINCSLINIKLFKSAYKEITDAISITKYHDLDEKINMWLSSIMPDTKKKKSKTKKPSIKIVSFIADTNSTNNLFQFFAIKDLDKNSNDNNHIIDFYSEKNLNKIRHTLDNNHKENDILISQNNEFIILKFSESNCQGEEAEHTIYMQLIPSNFDVNNSKTLWFYIKLILTLRPKMEHLIKDLNLPVVIAEKKNAMQKMALAIDKALTHSSAEAFLINDMFFATNDQGLYEDLFLKTYLEKINSDEKNVPYDKYYQMLANEYISSLYRNIIKKEDFQSEIDDVDESISYESFKDLLIGMFNISSKNTIDYYNMKIAKSIGINVNLEIKFDFSDEPISTTRVKQWYKTKGKILPVQHLIWLMAMNTIEHGCPTNSDATEYTMDVSITKNYISFKNRCINTNNKIDKMLHIPPWVFNTNTHVTLWSLSHYGEVKVEPSYSNNCFEIKFYIFKGEPLYE